MRERAFNLFTALVSFVLIVLALVLVQNMMRTERNTVDIIKSIEEQAEMQAIADLRRADAMQVFNYGVRWKISDYLIGEGGTYLLGPETRTWKEVQDDFAMSKFSGQFAKFTATVISSILGSGDVNSSLGAYSIAIVSASEGEVACPWGFTDTGECAGPTGIKAVSSWEIAKILQKSVDNSIAKKEFFQVVGCADGRPENCEPGTFYVTLDIKSLTDEEYEQLPQILVINSNTGRRIKEPILPRGKFRIFIPLRLFKAIAIARSIAFTSDDERSNEGLFSAKVHNEIEQMKLGMCDAKSCVPRTDPYNTAGASAITDDEYCPGDGRDADGYTVSFNCTGYSSGFDLCAGMSAYNASDEQSMTESLQKLVKRRICKLVESLNMPLEREGLRLIGNADACGAGADLTVTPTPKRYSKIIVKETAANGGTSASGFFHTPYARCQAPSGGGFYNDAGIIKPFKHTITDSGISVPAGEPYASASCTEVSLVQLTLKIRETNPAYMVNKDPSKYTEFNIKLSDDEYTPFTARLSTPGVDATGTCALESAPEEIVPVESEWTCHSRERTGTGVLGDPTIGPGGCYPEGST